MPPPLLKRIEESPFDPLGVLGLWAAGNLLLKHLYHSRHQALNCSIEIVGTLEKKELVFTLILSVSGLIRKILTPSFCITMVWPNPTQQPQEGIIMYV